MCKFWLKCTYSRVHMSAPFHDDHLQGGRVWSGQGESRGGCWRRSGRVICAVVTPHAAKKQKGTMCNVCTSNAPGGEGVGVDGGDGELALLLRLANHHLIRCILSCLQRVNSTSWPVGQKWICLRKLLAVYCCQLTTLQTRARCQNFTWQLSCEAGPQ